MALSDLYPRFQGHDIIQRQIGLAGKWCKIELYLQWPTSSKSYVIYRTAPAIFNDLEGPIAGPDFKVTPLFDAEYLRNGTKYSFSGILGTYTHRTQGCYFE